VTKLETIEGIGPVYATQLRKAGVRTVEALLEQGATPLGRQQMEQRTGIGHALISEWVNLADLMRIKGIGEQYSDLLEEAGVDTVKELRNRVPEHLHEALVRTNEAKRLVRRPPSLGLVRDWVGQAKVLSAGPYGPGDGPPRRPGGDVVVK
jgi:predicted flap endonuclease-1-like 5' DNA nuclease